MHETGRTPCAWPAGRAIFEKEESHRHRRGGWKTREGRGDETVRHRSYTSRPSGEDKGTVLLSSATIVPCPIRELLLRFTRCNNIFSRVPPPPPPPFLPEESPLIYVVLHLTGPARKRVATGTTAWFHAWRHRVDYLPPWRSLCPRPIARER